MGLKCQYSKIVIPGDPGYIEIAGDFAASVAKKLGFGETDYKDIKHCTEQATAWAIDYSLAENERISVEVSCEVIPQGFKISIKDQGLPYNPTIFGQARSEETPSSLPFKGCVDEIVFNNLGPLGKEVVLLKYSRQNRITDHYDACELERFKSPPEPAGIENLNYRIRSMKPDEAIEVSKCIYKGYGYTYPYEHVYYPTKLVEMNLDGSIFSAVAVSDSRDVVGHCALMFESPGDNIAEMGLGVVKPGYRSMGCFGKMTEFLIEKAKADQLAGLFVQAVTLHTYSQKTAARHLLKECALLLAYIPTTVDFRRVEKATYQRVTVFLCFRKMTNDASTEIYPPNNHKNIIGHIYNNIGLSPVLRSPVSTKDVALSSESIIRTKVLKTMRFARIVCESYGNNFIQEIEKRVRALCLRKIEVINLYLDLSNPSTGYISEKIERLGLFFAGILPGAMPNATDAIIFQYLNNIEVRYETLKAHSEVAKRLIAYVKKCDPNLQS